MDFKKLALQYKEELMNNVLPFWLEYSQDKEYGGYFTCLKRNGEVFDTDKFVWLQGREVWLSKVENFLKSTVMMETLIGIFLLIVREIH